MGITQLPLHERDRENRIELSFTANNFTNTRKWHTNKHTLAKRQLYPDMYFGAELKIKL